MFGGKHGYLVNTRTSAPAPEVKVEFKGQNGKSLTQQVATQTSCGGGKG